MSSEHPRRLHRGHLRRSVHHASGAADHHRPVLALGARSRAQAHRLRHVGDRLQVRSGHRARADRGRDPRRPAGIQRAPHDDEQGRPAEAADRAGRPDGAHLPHDRLLRRIARRAGPGRRRLGAPLLRGRLPGEQGDGRRAVLADPGHGGRVPGPGEVRHGEGGRRRKLPDARPERRRRPRGGRGRGGGDVGAGRASSCPSPAAWCAAAARWGRAGSRA